MNTINVSLNSITANNLSVYSGLINDLNNTSDFRNMINDMFSQNSGLEGRQELDVKIDADEKVKEAIFNTLSVINLMGNINQTAVSSLKDINNDILTKTIADGYGFDVSQRMLFLQGLKEAAVELTSSQAIKSADVALTTKAAVSATAGETPKVSIPVSAQIINETADTTVMTPNITATNKNDLNAAPKMNEIKQTPAVEPTPVKTSFAPQPAADKTENVLIPNAAVKAPENTVPVKMQAADVNTQPVLADNKTTKPASTYIEIAGPRAVVEKVPVIIEAVKQAAVQLVGMVKEFIVSNIQPKKQAQPALASVEAQVIDNNVNAAAISIENMEAGKVATKADIATVTVKDADVVTLTQTQALLASVVVSVQRVTVSGISNVAVSENHQAENTQTKAGITEQGINRINVSVQDSGSESKYMPATIQGEEVTALINKINTLLAELNGTMEITKTTQLVKAADTQGFTSNTPNPLTMTRVAVENTVPLTAGAETVQSSISNITDKPVKVSAEQTAAKDIFVPQKNIYVLTNSKTIVNASSPMIEPKVQADIFNNENSNPEIINSIMIARKAVFSGAEQLKSSIENKLFNEAEWVAKNVIMTTGFTQALNNSFTAAGSALANAATLARTVKDEVVLNQVLDGIDKNIIYMHKTEVKMILRPENLGPVFIKIEQKGKLISATIQAATTEVKDILRANSAELKMTLGNMGIKLDNFEISMINQNIGSGLQDAPKQAFKEWEGGVFRGDAAQIADTTGDYVNKDGYLNYLA